MLLRHQLRRLSTAVPKRVAFIGLGNMGAPMALNLVKAGFDLRVYDSSPNVSVEGLPPAHDSAVSAAKDAEIVVSMLPNGTICEQLYSGGGGLLSALQAGTTVLDCSTIDAPTAKRIAARAADEGIDYVDAPVSGGTAAAAAANLAFMCGGDAKAFERARPVLAGMGPPEKTFHAGPSGSGQVAKACNNMLLAVHMIGTCEALTMGARSGLEPAALSEILRASSGRNWSLEVYNPYPGVMEGVPASKGFQPGFMVDLMCKDLSLAMEVTKKAGVDNKMGSLAAELYAKHQADGSGALDFSSIINPLFAGAIDQLDRE